MLLSLLLPCCYASIGMRGGRVLVSIPRSAHLHAGDVWIEELLSFAQLIQCCYSLTAHVLQGVQMHPARRTKAENRHQKGQAVYARQMQQRRPDMWCTHLLKACWMFLALWCCSCFKSKSRSLASPGKVVARLLVAAAANTGFRLAEKQYAKSSVRPCHRTPPGYSRDAQEAIR